ncbi:MULTISPECIES: PepSY domain-containing protein [unclassified Pseudomonas]|uniref:PepSY domain-containing protein n=1 Tax=unclassified Pseudomonas TaxID=196821 RepID=UPI0021C8066D|nr:MULTISPECIES: PepSY domain-containing protein [unclassified Pseudomonas]MCU1731678.1 PepSY domain-containing protein [Pseudomonas sp. 20P_3.2_Bac4]MCU1743734.1 PepSY domain-containing protein [Pseudomonas sp. 20P_3.2_Bac5]
MKTLTALFATAALALSANAAMAKDVRTDEVVKLVQTKQIQSLDELNQKALAKHPGATIKDTELEDVYGRYVYKVELRDAQNVEWDVDLDAKTGEVLKDVQDR